MAEAPDLLKTSTRIVDLVKVGRNDVWKKWVID